ncbi:MAG: Na+/H+ antiporter NhaC [Spirochaetae bacterium HGW-Spirochaetae-3]|jgi:NhaC family Na+:H+ antiporter|nr:MAG: Na+/H+ antiporter NhaC [Spirochaetae bacterium HGW-Spirochaetae-3]
MAEKAKKEKKVSFGGALFVLLFLCVAMFTQIFVLHQDWVTHITLLLGCLVAGIVAMLSGFTWADVQAGILHGCSIAMLPMLILMLVGVLIASWIPAGVIPTLIYYGLKILSPNVFLVTVCFICCVASLATGSSWTTGATFGVAFMGIGIGLGIPPAMTAGAVVSGAIFGDKMSPLSDSTNLAAGVAEADLFDHIKSMIYTTGPALVISLVIYALLGLKFRGGAVDTSQINTILDGLKANYFISPVALLLPALVVFLAIKKVSGLAVMVIASVAGAIFAIIFQGIGIGEMMSILSNGFKSTTGVASVDSLLSRGGLQSMMWTISLGFIALSFGGILEKTGMLEALLGKISKVVNNVRGLIITHVISALAVNLFSASQYMAIIIPGRMLVPAYKKLNILPQVCSRTCEDSATVTSPLVPWGLCGVYFTGVLGVATVAYLPYTYLALITPLVAILYGLTNKFIWREGEHPAVRTYHDAEVKA